MTTTGTSNPAAAPFVDVDENDAYAAAVRDLVELVSIDNLPIPITLDWSATGRGLGVQVRGNDWEKWQPTIVRFDETYAVDDYTHLHATAVTHTGREFRLVSAFPTPVEAVAS